MDKRIIVLVGCSGSGKSTYARKYFPGAVIVSADHFFDSLAEGLGSSYRQVWSRELLPMAHEQCQKEFMDAVCRSAQVIVVDNTNIRTRDRKFYMMLGRLHGYQVEVHILGIRKPNAPYPTHEETKAYVDQCFSRNRHGVPRARVERQVLQQKLPAGVYLYKDTTTYLHPLPVDLEGVA